MLWFRVFAILQLRSASSPPRLCVRRLPRPGRGELCVKIPPSFNSRCHTSPKIPVKLPQNSSFQISALHTLPSSVSRNSCVCHSYENCRVYTKNSHFGSARAQLWKTCHSLMYSSPFFSHSCKLFCTSKKHIPCLIKNFHTLWQKTPGGGVPLPSKGGHFWYSGGPKMRLSPLPLPQNATRMRN